MKGSEMVIFIYFSIFMLHSSSGKKGRNIMRLLGFSVMLVGRSLSDPLGGKKNKKKIREEPELLYIKKNE